MARLIFVENEKIKEVVITPPRFTLGRAPYNDLPLQDDSIAEEHAEIILDKAGEYLISNLTTTSVTLVNQKKILRQKLSDNDEIKIGKSVFLFKRDSYSAETQKFLTLAEVSQAINSSLELKQVLNLIIDSALKITKGERGFIVLREPQTALLRVKVSRLMEAAELRDTEESFSRSIVKMVLNQGEPIITANAAKDERFKHQTSIIQQKLKSVIATPLKDKQKRVLGVIYLDSKITHCFRAEDLELMTIFSNQAAVAIENALLYERLKDKNKQLGQERYYLKAEESKEFKSFIGQSKEMLEVFKNIEKATTTDTTILIQGETGTGKELVARAIHTQSARREYLFVPVNCGALSETLLDAELFGYEKGAFTGATSSKVGLFELANNGTLFLDEITETSPAFQVKLLRVLQEGEIKPVGSNQLKKVNVRIITSTNKDLAKLEADGSFRKDLFYRLNVFPIFVPPLRARKDDIKPLVEYFISKYNAKCQRRIKGIAKETLTLLLEYDWPGNVRELENVIERAVLVEESEIITPKSILLPQVKAVSLPPELVKKSFKEAKELFEKEYISQRLKETGGNITQLAKEIGLHRTSLHEIINRHRLKIK
jgi:transcriptional regulator with GAF, ATPase, and Fis domain